MSLPWVKCDCCDEEFLIMGFGVDVQCGCGSNWCSQECAEKDSYQGEESMVKLKDKNHYQFTSCNQCRDMIER